MHKKLRVLSGAEVVAIFERFGFVQKRARGSHVILKRSTESGSQTLVVPLHTTVRPGTLVSIYKKARVYIGEYDLREHFYTT